ncbi:hypothetical protein DFH07DRAFT_942828 [Mycena maculata]|uniref:YTH domain-containing protein n=1 Tax=Mycena maculata TaxID=230809 RepID=A0AAD7IKX2_9AGAR|nr:hypothetical protein DFH07DRAFT_942828 [Mycena maculata]
MYHIQRLLGPRKFFPGRRQNALEESSELSRRVTANQFVTLLIPSLQNTATLAQKKSQETQKVFHLIQYSPHNLPEAQLEEGAQSTDISYKSSDFDGPAAESNMLPLQYIKQSREKPELKRYRDGRENRNTNPLCKYDPIGQNTNRPDQEEWDPISAKWEIDPACFTFLVTYMFNSLVPPPFNEQLRCAQARPSVGFVAEFMRELCGAPEESIEEAPIFNERPRIIDRETLAGTFRSRTRQTFSGGKLLKLNARPDELAFLDPTLPEPCLHFEGHGDFCPTSAQVSVSNHMSSSCRPPSKIKQLAFQRPQDEADEHGGVATQKHNAGVLDCAFRTSHEVFLIFSANRAGNSSAMGGSTLTPAVKWLMFLAEWTGQAVKWIHGN